MREKPPAGEVQSLARVLRLAALEANRFRYRKVGNELDRLAGWLEFEARGNLVQDDIFGPPESSKDLAAIAEKLRGKR